MLILDNNYLQTKDSQVFISLELRLQINMSARADLKSDNLQYNMVGQWVDGMIVPPSDGPKTVILEDPL